MKLEVRNLTVYLNDDGNGFALGYIEDPKTGEPIAHARVVPQIYVDDYNAGKLNETPAADFPRIYQRFNWWSVKNLAPIHARITKNGSLILE